MMMLSMLYRAMGKAREFGASKALSDNPDDTPEAREKKRKKAMQMATGVPGIPKAMDLAAKSSLQRRAATRISYGL